ncbi:MAG: ECF-type sigma factor [Pirellulaceae bacterium]|jgi:RNA polymerase sigma factor (sigma-70 family)|nr:ECF-type sigma factor [Pirellulaceae bacterium]
MSTDDSVTVWIEGLKAGQEAAAAKLWTHFYSRLIALACRRLRHLPRRAADEEDVVVNVFESFFRRAQAGQFPRLHDRHDLWQLLVTITERKALNQVRDLTREKRGGGQVRGESAFWNSETSADGAGIDQVVGPQPTPEFAAAVTDELRHLLELLDGDMRHIAQLKLEGYTNEEIATTVGCSLPTVERRLRLIRKAWHGRAM